MISFRFHVVSITAIFLAIAIGVVVGSTYIDRITVDRLENRIDAVEDRAEAAREENARLEDELDRTQGYVDLSSQFAVTDRLTDVPVLVTAARGVDEASVEDTVVLARQAGAVVPGIVWVEPRWALEGDDDAEALAAIVGGSSSDDPEELWAAAWQGVTDELATADVSEQGQAGTMLGDLEAAGFLTVDSLDDDTVALADLAGAGPRVLMLTGARAESEVAPVIPVAASATSDGGLVTVVGDIYVRADEAPGRGVALTEMFDDATLDSIVIVDAADLEAGRVAAVLALDSAADGQLGLHFGYGEGADAVLPAWTAL
jgi:Copper transport outer membrane protein, MctB